MSIPVYTWKDVVLIRGKCYGETFEISGETDLLDGRIYYQIDDFMMAVSVKYDIDVDDIETYMMDNIEFDPNEIGFGAEDCGCYIDGVPEWSDGSPKHPYNPVFEAYKTLFNAKEDELAIAVEEAIGYLGEALQ